MGIALGSVLLVIVSEPVRLDPLGIAAMAGSGGAVVLTVTAASRRSPGSCGPTACARSDRAIVGVPVHCHTGSKKLPVWQIAQVRKTRYLAANRRDRFGG